MAITKKLILFRVTTPCSLVDVYRGFAGTSCFTAQVRGAGFSALYIEAKYSTLKIVQQISSKFNTYCDMTCEGRNR